MGEASSPPRVLSLLSASTEMVCRLGCAHLLVGRSHGCDDPPLATSLPAATAPRVDPSARSRDLDAAVRAQAASGGPIYHVRSDQVRALRPDVIITQEQCRICAVTPEDVAEACAGLPAATLVTIKPTTLDDVFGDIVAIAAALGVPARGERLERMLRARLAALRELAPAPAPAPRVAHLEWLAPLMGSGYWIAECMEAANCVMVQGCRGGHSQVLDRVSMLAEAEVIIIAPCGFGIERTHAELAGLGLLDSAEWRALPAVASGRVAVADGNRFFNRSSCGVVETAEIVAEASHPDLCGLFGHHGRFWVRLAELGDFCGREGAPPPTKPVAVAPALGAKPSAAPPDPPDGDRSSASAHARAQVACLRAGDFAGAFALNSAANRARLGDADKFAAIVAGNASFAALAQPANGAHFEEAAPGAVRVRVQSPHETYSFVFDVSTTAAGAFATDGVRIEC